MSSRAKRGEGATKKARHSIRNGKRDGCGAACSASSPEEFDDVALESRDKKNYTLREISFASDSPRSYSPRPLREKRRRAMGNSKEQRYREEERRTSLCSSSSVNSASECQRERDI